MEIEIDIKQIAKLVKSELTGDTKVWDDYVPILKGKKSLDIYLTDSISVPAEYNEMCSLITTASPNTKVTLHINNGGGIIDAAFMIIDAIKKSKAQVHAVLSGTVASAATVITLACDTIEVVPYTSFMIHNYSSGTQGKGHEMKAYMDFNNSELNNAFKDIYAGFLTEDEMQSVIDGKDMWMGQAEVLERWNNKLNS